LQFAFLDIPSNTRTFRGEGLCPRHMAMDADDNKDLRNFKKVIMCDGKQKDQFSNFYHSPFEVDGKLWPTAEHYYQALKFPENDAKSEAFREELRETMSPMDCWKLGQHAPTGVQFRKDWESVKVDAMYQANLAKFSGSPHLSEILTSSKGRILCDGGHFWKTWNEVVLERVREELRCASDRDETILAILVGCMDAYKSSFAAGDVRAAQAATDWAAKRMLPPTDPTGGQVIQLEGQDPRDDWLGDPFKVDPCRPEINGQPHFLNEGGGHLYLGLKGAVRNWIIDEECSPNEACGHAFLACDDEGGPPLGRRSWQYFDHDSGRHVKRELVLC